MTNSLLKFILFIKQDFDLNDKTVVYKIGIGLILHIWEWLGNLSLDEMYIKVASI